MFKLRFSGWISTKAKYKKGYEVKEIYSCTQGFEFFRGSFDFYFILHFPATNKDVCFCLSSSSMFRCILAHIYSCTEHNWCHLSSSLFFPISMSFKTVQGYCDASAWEWCFPIPPSFILASQVSWQMVRDQCTPWQHCHFVNTHFCSSGLFKMAMEQISLWQSWLLWCCTAMTSSGFIIWNKSNIVK